MTDWNYKDPQENGRYTVLVLMCDCPYEEKEDVDQFINGYWQIYAQFVQAWKPISKLTPSTEQKTI